MTTELPTIPHTTFPGRADHPISGLGEALAKLPAFETLRAAAKEEALINQAAEKFSRKQADADFEAASKALRQNPTPENLAALKNLGGREQRRAAYEEHSIAIREDLRCLRKKNFPALEAVSRIAIDICLLRAREARSEIDGVFQKHHLPTPAPESIEAPFWNTARWYVENLRMSGQGFGMAFDRLVKQLVGQ